MSTRFRGLPPRVLLNKRDNRGSRIPTVARTVSSTDRTGAHALAPFDDRKTLIFESGTLFGVNPLGVITPGIAMPLGLQSSALENGLYDSLIDLLAVTGTLTSNTDNTGSVVAGIADEFIEQPDNLLSFSPYTEDKQFEQGNTSSFYLTGTNQETVGPGFTSQLISKTQIRLRLPHAQSYNLPATTASIAYYSLASQSFGPVGDFTNPQQAFVPRTSVDEVIPSPDPADPDTGIMNYAFDARLFGPLGNAMASGTRVGSPIAGNYNCPSTLIGTVIGQQLARILSETNDETVTLNPTFAAPSGTIIQLDEIQQPFLLEKVSFELPFKQGAGWSDDTTTLVYAPGFGQDIGGPCITVALLREGNAQHREIILSATIIPEGDNFSEDYDPVPAFAAQPAPHGFASFSKPTVVVTSSFTTGILRFDVVPTISNGVFAMHTRGANEPETFDQSRIRMFNPFGRALRRDPSGRSYFGKEFTIPRRNRPPIFSGERLDVFFFEQSSESPYVLLPGDKLILAIAKHRPVIENPATLANGGDRTTMTASHDASIPVGTINITLYGSLIQEAKEFHFGRNEPLTSHAASETLSFDNAVLDQFDVAHRSIFSGSYLDEFVTGSIGATSDPDKRQVVGSSIAGTTNKELQRFVKLLSVSERFFSGSILPDDPNDFTTKPSGYFRGNRYGQFRDQLEQQINTKFFTDGKLLDAAVRVRFTPPDPADTDSSNLSFEATSSLPYFDDGVTHNRGDLPSTEVVQLDLPDFVVNP